MLLVVPRAVQRESGTGINRIAARAVHRARDLVRYETRLRIGRVMVSSSARTPVTLALWQCPVIDRGGEWKIALIEKSNPAWDDWYQHPFAAGLNEVPCLRCTASVPIAAKAAFRFALHRARDDKGV